jgi:cell division septation protein DedD
MAQKVASRTQRRMEKRQALLMLFLMLVVSLVSFSLGVMVGKSGSREAISSEPAALLIKEPVAKEAEQKPLQAEPSMQDRPAENLTFYDTLPRGEQPPLGSGINLPPKEEKAAEEPTEQPILKAKLSDTPKTAFSSEPSAENASLPAASTDGRYVVQVASFRERKDARNLKERLSEKGYPVFTQMANLGEKGIWHRVLIGPLENADAAGEVVERLKTEDKLLPIVKKR